MQEVVKFNEDVRNHEILEEYHVSHDDKRNKTAVVIEKISDYSREIIVVGIDALLSITNGFN